MDEGYEFASARRAPWARLGQRDDELGRRLRRAARHAAVAVVAAVVLNLCTAAPASAAQGASGRAQRGVQHLAGTTWLRQATAGTVTAVGGLTTTGSCGASGSTGSFTLADRKGATITVDVTSSTVFGDRSDSSPSYAQVCVGADVAVLGTSASTDSTLVAAKVYVLATPPRRAPVSGGEVTSVGGLTTTGSCGTSGSTGSFTVSDWKSATITVDVTSSTTFAGWNVSSPSYADVCVGTGVAVLGTSGSTNTAIVAAKVFVMAPWERTGRSNGGDPGTGATHGGVSASASSGNTGTTPTTWGGSGTHAPSQAGTVVDGTVTVKAASSLTVDDQGRPVPVALGTSTRYWDLGDPSSLQALAVGDRVHIVGTTTDGTFTASSVTVVADAGAGAGAAPGAWGSAGTSDGRPASTGEGSPGASPPPTSSGPSPASGSSGWSQTPTTPAGAGSWTQGGSNDGASSAGGQGLGQGSPEGAGVRH